jgi:hypothetical protein
MQTPSSQDTRMTSAWQKYVSASISERGWRQSVSSTLFLLAAQFLVGMVVNLFVTVPSVHPGINAPEYFSGVVQGVAWALFNAPAWLLIHVIIGLLLFLGIIGQMAFAIVSRRGERIIISVLGFIGTVFAGFNGASFLNYGANISSLLMSIGFLLATISYTIGISLTVRRGIVGSATGLSE